MNCKLIFMLCVSIIISSCSDSKKQESINAKKNDTLLSPSDIIRAKENQSISRQTDSFGVIIDQIEFKCRVYGEDLKVYTDGYLPWISLDSPQKRINELVDKDVIVIKQQSLSVYVDYPLNKPTAFQLESNSGFTRKSLIEQISSKYHELYMVESETSSIKVIPPNERKQTYNRNETNGKYCIWGHDLSDLDLSSIEVHKRADGKIILVLNIES